MTIYSIIYIILALLIVLQCMRNRFDLLSVAALCYLVYTMYCIPGTGIAGWYRPRLSPKLYYSVYMQMILLLVFIEISRTFLRKRGLPSKAPRKKWLDTNPLAPDLDNEELLRLSFRIYTMIIFAFALLNIVKIGPSAFAAGKSIVWERTNVLYIISLYGSWVSFAYGIHKNDKWCWGPALFVELTIFFAGSRAFTATMMVIFFCEKGLGLWKNRKGTLWLYILGAAGLMFMLLYRAVDTTIMAGDMHATMRVLQDPETWSKALEFNEPRVIIANYDYVFTSGVRFPVGDIVYKLIDFIPGTTSLIPIKLAYPEYFSTWLMEQVNASAGVGGTIWGEGYAMFGYAGVLFFTFVWLAFINLCNTHLDFHESHSYFLVSLGAYLGWYIHRLDFNRVAQACKVMLFCFLIWVFVFLVVGGALKIGQVVFRFRGDAAAD